MRTIRGARHLTKRLRQTPVLFRNFPTVLWNLGTAETRFGRPELTFRMRNGYVVQCPNADGARFPLYEVFGDDAYRMDELLGGIDPDAVILDIGGQIGSFALACAAAGPSRRVQVYEASPTSAGYIQRNVTANGLDDRVKVHAAALAGEVGEFVLIDSGTASGHNGLTAPDFLIEAGATEVTVPAETFDRAVAAAGGPVQVVKMDVEGAEYDIILRSTPSSWADVRRVVMEYHPVEGHSLDELLAFFAEVGLTPGHHEPGLRAGLGVIWLQRGGPSA